MPGSRGARLKPCILRPPGSVQSDGNLGQSRMTNRLPMARRYHCGRTCPGGSRGADGPMRCHSCQIFATIQPLKPGDGRNGAGPRGLSQRGKPLPRATEMPRLCVRDERGWLVPAAGTMARAVYDVLVAAEQCEEQFRCAVLAELLGTTTNSVQATAWRIRCAAKSTRRSQPTQLKIKRADPAAPHHR
jgi:hypothetical protein